MEYRVNYITDAIVQPTVTVGVELLLWFSIFKTADTQLIRGFPKEAYLAYALWAAFFSRIAASWMYEFKMIDEVESGSINSVLCRPTSFYEYYLSQLMGYKLATTFISFLIPLIASILIPSWPVHFERLPLAVALVTYYLLLVHSFSFVISCCAFFLNRIHSFTVAKNLLFWILTGDIVPLDLVPEPFYTLMVSLPFPAGVFVPVGYLTGRIELNTVVHSFTSVTVGLVVVNLFGTWLWRRGLAVYTGTGA